MYIQLHAFPMASCNLVIAACRAAQMYQLAIQCVVFKSCGRSRLSVRQQKLLQNLLH